MGKKLKLGFAMGGGVSLGTFSGAALTEAIKQAIVFGKDENGKEYDKVEIDVFAGASAGSMSLGIMLRGMVDPAITQKLKRSVNVEGRLKDQFGTYYDSLSNDKKVDLQCAQLVQDLQEEIWIKEINIENLIPKEGSELLNEAGMLQNATVNRIAKKYFKPLPDVKNKRLLSKRVVFASTLSNLTPICYDAKNHFDTKPKNLKGEFDDTLLTALNDAMISYGHRELRIFDLFFDEKKASEVEDEPMRWCRYHLGEKLENEVPVGSINTEECWSKIAATVIASGAFPFMFEPVVLCRHRHEFGNTWPKKLKAKEHLFTYVDGGTFNNEPIREAFRLASFIDSEDDQNSKSFDRRIIFVDPNVSESAEVFTVPVHQKYSNNKSSTRLLKTRDRLFNKLSSMITAFSNEARAIEGDKVMNIRDKFGMRRDLRKGIIELKNLDIDSKTLQEVIIYLREYIKYEKENTLLPLNKHNLKSLLEYIIATNTNYKGLSIELSVKNFLDKVENLSDNIPMTGWWYSVLMYIYLDLAMGLYGKNENTYLLPIAPFKFDEDSKFEEPKGKIWLLPGNGLAGFAGFASDQASEFEVKFGKYCAAEYLRYFGLIPFKAKTGKETQAPEKLTYEDIKQDEKYLQRIGIAYSRLFSVITNESILQKIGLGFLKFINVLPKEIDGKGNTKEYQLRIKVPSNKYELDSERIADIGDIRPIEILGEHYLIAFAEYNSDTKEWIGNNIKDGRLRIDQDRTIVWDKLIAAINMPTEDKIEELELMPDPIFYYEITEDNHENFDLPAKEWDCTRPGIVSLESTVFG